MTLKGDLPADMLSDFLDLEAFGEPVTYFAGGDLSSTGREIAAVIERTAPATQGFDRSVQRPVVVEAWIAREAEKGVVAVDIVRDLFRFPAHIGEREAIWRVEKQLHADEGAWRLLLIQQDPTRGRR